MTALIDEEGAVGARRGEAHAEQLTTKAEEPSPRRLLEPIQGLDELAHMIGVVLVDEASWLVAVDALGEIAMQERILDVELVYCPPPCRGEVKDSPDGCRLDHWGKGLMEVDPWAL